LEEEAGGAGGIDWEKQEPMVMGLAKEDPPASYNRQPSFHEEEVHTMSAVELTSSMRPMRTREARNPPAADPPLATDSEKNTRAIVVATNGDRSSRRGESASSSSSRWCDPTAGILDQPWCDPDGVLGRFVLSIGTGPSSSALPSSSFSSKNKKREGADAKGTPKISDLLSPVSNDATEVSSVDDMDCGGADDYYTYSASYSEWSPSFEEYDGDASTTAKIPPNKQRRGRFLVWPASGR
jgi:hypothetical protein